MTPRLPPAPPRTELDADETQPTHVQRWFRRPSLTVALLDRATPAASNAEEPSETRLEKQRDATKNRSRR